MTDANKIKIQLMAWDSFYNEHLEHTKRYPL
jgi:hypothetical protein